MSVPLLRVDNLKTYFDLSHGRLYAVDDVSFQVGQGETFGIVGESGSGKSILARSIIGLLPISIAKRAGGKIEFDGQDLMELSEAGMRKVRGRDIAIIFQDPLTSLNPVLPIGRQLVQVLRNHTDLSRRAAKERAVELLAEVGIPGARQRAEEYAHRMSGGMRQRIVIAIALACNPRLLIADEPTTALDVTVQAQILELLRRLQESNGMSLIMITHNFGVVAEMCDRVGVMYAGRMVEQGNVAALLTKPRMRYTRALLDSIPRKELPRHARLQVIAGHPPDLTRRLAGCAFAPRCPDRLDICGSELPSMISMTDHQFQCWNPSGVES
ncbi:ABC transporter ATP-binding protein [Bradyrhizobium sp. BR13661]|jgi:peptide/nickel transport system ATP-binding protein|uniref:ABC transporter ATP-binding protein n=2 Tax=Pseudomonadota TaxID=1224 RepID=UPI0024761D59|nr:ABC transporter ATP-binding protein [Bradyrhizobium sp. BR13661]MDH6260529.1 peptide/nickel transport system ATP-binding protein [Bradyrhizobium sp. BR13661]